jgi:uncharacterized protein (TIGR00290 family)
LICEKYILMAERPKVVMNWSSGKDAALAYHILLKERAYDVKYLLTTLNDEHERIFMHGVRERMLDLQAERMNMPLIKLKLPPSPDDTVYKNAMGEALGRLKQEGITVAAFGDIFLEDLKAYREQQLAQIGMQGLFPLWKKDTRELVSMIGQVVIEAMIVCVNEQYLGKEFLGRKVDAALLDSLPSNVDPCGENGEFHTFVYNAPFFSSPIPLKTGEVVHKKYMPSTSDDKGWSTGFYFLDIDLA